MSALAGDTNAGAALSQPRNRTSYHTGGTRIQVSSNSGEECEWAIGGCVLAPFVPVLSSRSHVPPRSYGGYWGPSAGGWGRERRRCTEKRRDSCTQKRRDSCTEERRGRMDDALVPLERRHHYETLSDSHVVGSFHNLY